MPEPAIITIKDLLDKNKLKPEEEILVARQLGKEKRAKITFKGKVEVKIKAKENTEEKSEPKNEEKDKPNVGTQNFASEGEGENRPGEKAEKKENPEGEEKPGGEGEGEKKSGEENEPREEYEGGEGENPEEEDKPGDEGKNSGDENVGAKNLLPEKNPGEEGEERPRGEDEEANKQPESLNNDAQTAEQLKEGKNEEREKRGRGDGEGERAEKNAGDEEDKGNEGNWGSRLRELKEKAKKKIEEKVTAPIKKASGQGLQKAWLSLGTVFGAIIGIIWINIHVFLRWVFGEKLFCKLGEEWLPPQAVEATGEAGETITKSAGLIETMVLIFIDVIIFFIIAVLISLFINESTLKNIAGEANEVQPAPAAQQTK